jgi:hypothetical protein
MTFCTKSSPFLPSLRIPNIATDREDIWIRRVVFEHIGYVSKRAVKQPKFEVEYGNYIDSKHRDFKDDIGRVDQCRRRQRKTEDTEQAGAKEIQ